MATAAVSPGAVVELAGTGPVAFVTVTTGLAVYERRYARAAARARERLRLRDRLEISESDLSKQMSTLETAGYVTMAKDGHGRVLSGEGRASAERRARAFSSDGLSPPLDALIGKVALRPTQVTEADFAMGKARGLSEDQLFELVVCAAVGQSTRLYEAGLAALAAATGSAKPDHAT